MGFGKLFCSNSDKVLKVADDLLFTVLKRLKRTTESRSQIDLA